MNCPKCGQELSDRSAFCPNCGMAILRKEEAPEQVPAAEPAAESSAAVQIPEVSAQETVAEVSEAPEVPKKKNFWQKFRLPICIGVPAVAVILLVAFNLNWIVGTFLKTFAKPETYYAHVEEETFTDLTENVSKLYGTVFGTGEKSKDTVNAGKGNIKISIGKDALSLLNQASGQDLSWLSEINLGVDANVDGDLMEATYDIGLKSGKIVSVHMVMDLANMKAWIGVPDLNPTYLEIDVMELASGGVSSDAVAVMPSYGYAMPAVSTESGTAYTGSSMVYDILMDVMENGAEFLPSEEELNELLDRYVKVALGAITDVEKGSEDLSVAGVKQKVTTLEVDFSEETLLDVLTAVLNEAKEDEDLKAIVEKAEKYIEKEYLNGEDTGLSKMLDEGIETYLDQLDEVEASSETVLTMTTYINGSHEIVGREFSSGDQDVLFYAKVNKGSKFGFELAVRGETLIEGSGKESGGKMTGTFEVGMQDVEICEIEVEEFDLDALEKEGYLNGTFRIKPSEALMEQLDLPSVLSSDLALELVCVSSEGKADLTLKLLVGGKNFVSVQVTSEATDGGSVSKPSDVIDVANADEDEMMEWVGSVDFEKLLKNVKSAGVPDELVSQMEALLEDSLG